MRRRLPTRPEAAVLCYPDSGVRPGVATGLVKTVQRRPLTFQDRLIAAANSRAGRRGRILAGTLALLAALRLRGPARFALALAGALAAIPALWGFCL